MNFQRYSHTLGIAVEAVFANRFRSMLTALGIIFGVAAVIAMMAIGNGARQEILDQIKLVGVNNILITPIYDMGSSSEGDEESTEGQVKSKYSPGLTLEDAMSIKKIIPTVSKVSPEVTYETDIIKSGKRSKAKLNGVTREFFEVYQLSLKEGQYFTTEQELSGSPVCIIGPSVKAKFFPQENPIGKFIKCGGIWLKVIGILETRVFSTGDTQDLGIADYSQNIYAPVQTVLRRYKDRALVNEATLRGGGTQVTVRGGSVSIASFGSSGDKDANYHQLDKIIVQVKDSEDIQATTQVLKAMLKRRHADVEDYLVRVPELLLKQEQKTKDIFNIVLGVIASISLLVGGIGIMNIMLASVMERIREIGVRMATGATKRDIIFQFLSEATIISITGGFIGIVLGILFARIITSTTGILTIVSPLSLFVSFGVSATIGILFGYMPAKRASDQDPIETLRYE